MFGTAHLQFHPGVRQSRTGTGGGVGDANPRGTHEFALDNKGFDIRGSGSQNAGKVPASLRANGFAGHGILGIVGHLEVTRVLVAGNGGIVKGIIAQHLLAIPSNAHGSGKNVAPFLEDRAHFFVHVFHFGMGSRQNKEIAQMTRDPDHGTDKTILVRNLSKQENIAIAFRNVHPKQVDMGRCGGGGGSVGGGVGNDQDVLQ